MKNDLKIIKRKYGEKMMHLARKLFPTLLEEEGLLSSIMLKLFEPNRDLYDDIINNNLEVEFKNFIYSQVDVENGKRMITIKTPEELMEEAGYNLYLCKNEEDIQSFRKYYAKGEELCTFMGGRLERCHVFFAVRHDVDSIRREEFKNPKREDLYGTSVISIQFDRDYTHNLSIKNRYNHRVNDPDATFSNNLDNIIEGLTDSFAKYYGLEQKYRHFSFEIPGYVLARDGKYYKYNFELYNTYYCPNNIIIENGEVKKYDKAKYIVFDYFILKLDGEKKIFLADNLINDSFIQSIGDIRDAKIEITNQDNGKKIVIKK